jgi:hypothetical protein
VAALLVGVISVGLVVGIMVGRTTERARRSLKDMSAARTTYVKGRKVAYSEMGRAVGVVAITALIFVALFIGMLNSQR